MIIARYMLFCRYLSKSYGVCVFAKSYGQKGLPSEIIARVPEETETDW